MTGDLPATFVAVATLVDGQVRVSSHGRHTPGQQVESAVTLVNPGRLVVVGFADSEEAALDEAQRIAEAQLRRMV